MKEGKRRPTALRLVGDLPPRRVDTTHLANRLQVLALTRPKMLRVVELVVDQPPDVQEAIATVLRTIRRTG